MVKVILFATHPYSTNGYSYVAYNTAKWLSKKPDIDLVYWGFQNTHNVPGHDKERSLPDNVEIYDAMKNENPVQLGFGFDQVTDYVTMSKPDICIIMNDCVVISNIIEKLNKVENKKFKIIIYLDQVYDTQRKEHVQLLNNYADFVICFTKYWEQCIKTQGLTVPTSVYEHGIDPMNSFSVPKELCRTYFNLNKDDFIIVNGNRNQPRKRLDLMMMAFAEVISRHLEDPIKLLIATSPMGAWNLLEIYEHELKLRGVTFEQGMKHIIFIDNPQMLTDLDMNILYNACDVGINPCAGEGYGLSNFLPSGAGIPQIVTNVGGFLDFYNDETAYLIEPKINLYTDMSIDGCPGKASIPDYKDFADAIEEYYVNDSLRKKHSINGKKHILENYQWEPLVNKLYDYIKYVYNGNKKELDKETEKEIINKLKSKLKVKKN
jgi:glycosyltransferase involved in cell wall biosynthesis